ncbi:MAG: glutathionylspermidine synthase family protein [Alphaproteobacteria bacterium]
MERLTTEPRADWRERAEAIGFRFHTIDGQPYWTEDACYRFSEAEIDALEEATVELERLCLAAVDRVVGERLYDRLGIPADAHEMIAESWRRFDRNMIGRFDLSYGGEGPPKLLEYNADTPTSLFEASVVQWEWLQTVRPNADQFNSIHEKLVEAWAKYGVDGTLHFTCVRDHEEDFGTTEYLRDTAVQAGLDTGFLFIDEIGWDGVGFVDRDDRYIRSLFKLYPWEWLIEENFGAYIGPSRALVIEPPWKMVLSNKAILPILWEMFPDHPNLLPASLDPADIAGPMVAKPALGREGQGVTIHRDGPPVAVAGNVYQSFAPLPAFDGRYAVIGSWVIASQPAGIGIREDDAAVTLNTSRFVPHFFA